jgi:hypothetical protein
MSAVFDLEITERGGAPFRWTLRSVGEFSSLEISGLCSNQDGQAYVTICAKSDRIEQKIVLSPYEARELAKQILGVLK